MSILDHKIGAWTQSVSSLPVHPSAEGMTAAELQAAFDSNSEQLKEAFNGFIDYLEPNIEGEQSIFIAEYGVTTYAEITAARTAGQTVFVLHKSEGFRRILTASGHSASTYKFVGFDIWMSTNDLRYLFASVDSTDRWNMILGAIAKNDSPSFTGTPAAPTPTAGDSSTKIATTAFVAGAAAGVDKVFIVTPETTTFAEIRAAISGGKIPVILDDSNSKAEVYVCTYRLGASFIDFVCAYPYSNANSADLYLKTIMVNAGDQWYTYTSRIASTSSVTDAINDAAAGLQNKITASGILKGDGAGGVTGAVSGTDYQAPLPSQTGNAGKFLKTNGSTLSWEDVSGGGDVFIAEYGVTTYAEITAAVADGKPCLLTGSGGFTYPLSRQHYENGTYYYQFIGLNGTNWINEYLVSQADSWSLRSYKRTALPSQTGNTGKFLMTDGNDLSWEDVSGGIVNYGTCSTSANTKNKVATVSGDFTLAAGRIVAIKFDNSTTYNTPDDPITLNVNSTGDKEIIATSNGELIYRRWRANEVVWLCYDGYYWRMIDRTLASTTYPGIVKLSSAIDSSSETEAATSKAVKDALDAAKAYTDGVCGDIETALISINTALGGIV